MHTSLQMMQVLSPFSNSSAVASGYRSFMLLVAILLFITSIRVFWNCLLRGSERWSRFWFFKRLLVRLKSECFLWFHHSFSWRQTFWVFNSKAVQYLPERKIHGAYDKEWEGVDSDHYCHKQSVRQHLSKTLSWRNWNKTCADWTILKSDFVSVPAFPGCDILYIPWQLR